MITKILLNSQETQNMTRLLYLQTLLAQFSGKNAKSINYQEILFGMLAIKCSKSSGRYLSVEVLSTTFDDGVRQI